MAGSSISAERLREVVHYDPETGEFTNKVKRANAQVGKKLGGVNAKGYIVIGIDDGIYLAHRLAWLHTQGAWPAQIDHINGIKTDNRLANLRNVSYTENNQNIRKARAGSKSGVQGVSSQKNTKRWRVKLQVEGKQIHIGYFDTPEQARAAYLEAKQRLYLGYPR